jgi:His/Glu/Gln/Arg/opine family amino acid ABC transporter permease subunit
MNQIIRSLPVLFEALQQTLLLSALTIVFSGLLGFVIGEISTLAGRLAGWLVRMYVEFVRGIPLLVFIFLFYYLLPAAGIQTDAFSSAVMSLVLYFSAFVAEIVRGAVQSIPQGQINSGLALGMRRLKVERIVVLPQAFRIALPPLLNLCSIIVKSTSLVSIIGVWELTYATREIVMRTVLPFEFFIFAMIIYFVVCYSIVRASKFLESKMTMAHR